MFTVMATPYLEGGPSEATQSLQLQAFIHRRLIELIVQIATPAASWDLPREADKRALAVSFAEGV